MKFFDSKERTALHVIGAMTVALLFCLPGFSQLNLGRIFGAITDQSGGAIVGATVTVTDVARGISRPLVSDSAGEYEAPSLTPGTYTVRAAAAGFKIAEHTDIEVGVGKDVKIDLTLQPGAQTQTVTVTGDIPVVNTANAELGGTLDQVAVSELPVEGRNYQYLIGTQPGMTMAPSGGQFTYISDGISNHMETWMIDGLLNTNENVGGPSLVGGASQNGDEGNILPLDAIQEVQMIENPNAVYGDKPGAHVNVGLKSGTNALHGSAYAYGKDGGWAAKNPFLTSALPKGPLALEQFGASLGGPIKKNRIFYFANYEGQRFAAGVPKIAFEPTTASGAGAGQSIPDAVFDILHNAKNTASVPVSALSLNLSGCAALVSGQVTSGGTLTSAQGAVLQSMTATQLAAGCNAGAGLFGNSGSSQNEVNDLLGRGGSDNGIIKVDIHPNDRHSLNFEWFSGGGNVISPGNAVQPFWEADAHDWANMGRAVWIWTPNSTWLNEFRFGYDYGNLPIYVRECDHPGIGPNYASLGFVSGAPPCEAILSPGNFVLGGFPLATIGAFTGLGETNGNVHDQVQHYFTFLDNVSWTHGKHVVTFGTENRFLNYDADARGGIGTLLFGTTPAFATATPLEDFLTGTATSGSLLVGNSVRNVNRPSYAVFVQDSWRVLPRVTVNAGLRYEFTGALTEQHDLLGNFDPSLPLATNPTGLFQETSKKNIYQPYNVNFGPRLGIAWDVFGNGKTVVHIGGSVLFDSQPYLLTLLFSGQVSTIPTGYTFVRPDGSTFAGPGNIAAATVNPQGGIPGAVGNNLPWTVGNPVFSVSTTGLMCGNGVAVPTGSPKGAAPPAPCSLAPYDLNIRYPYYFMRTLGIQHAFTNNLSLTVAYVGNAGENLDSQNNINAPTPGVSGTAAEQARRPFNNQYPFYSNILYETHGQHSNYNGVQLSLIQRVFHGLSYTAGYTFSHTLDNVTTAMNPLNPMQDYGNSSINFPSTFNFTATYLIPGKRSPAQLLQGWQVNSTVYLLAGGSSNANDPTDDLSGVSGGVAGQERWTMSPHGKVHDFKIGGPGAAVPCFGIKGSLFASFANCQTVADIGSMPSLCMSTAAAEATNPSVPSTNANATGLGALATFGCYLAGGTAIVPPAQGTFGAMAPNALYGHHFHNWDFSLTKNWKFKERYGVQFRAEFFNVLNRTSYSAGSGNLHFANTFGQSTSSPDSGNPVIGNGPRKIQLGLHVSF